MTTDPLPEPEGPQDEPFVYVATTEGVEALREGAAVFDSERVTPTPISEQRIATPPRARRTD